MDLALNRVRSIPQNHKNPRVMPSNHTSRATRIPKCLWRSKLEATVPGIAIKAPCEKDINLINKAGPLCEVVLLPGKATESSLNEN